MDETLVKHQIQQNNTSLDQSECVVTQPAANGLLPHVSTAQAPPRPHYNSKDCDVSTGGSVTDSLSSNDNAQLLPSSSPCSQSQTANSCEDNNGNHVSPESDHHHQTGSNQKETSPAHIKQAAGGDCCVHCLLACLFCELPSLCSALVQCLLCGGGAACAEGGGACCCLDALIGCCSVEAGCTEGCGVIETCCGSTDCLEICLECCSICFPS
ncbi:unnamed protein product [Knipowitschia caucasica]